jgi:hypothetical protein
MASSKSVGQAPSKALQPPVQIHEHRPGKTIQQAINNANAHVANVNAASKGK